jgi:hypothetical protein
MVVRDVAPVLNVAGRLSSERDWGDPRRGTADQPLLATGNRRVRRPTARFAEGRMACDIGNARAVDMDGSAVTQRREVLGSGLAVHVPLPSADPLRAPSATGGATRVIKLVSPQQAGA